MAIKWLWEHRAFEWNYSTPFSPKEIEQRLRDALLNRGIVFGWEKGFDGEVTSGTFNLHYVDGGEGRSVNLNGTIQPSDIGSTVRVTCVDSSDERRMFMIVLVFIASIMTLGLGYRRFGPVVFLAPLLYWIAQLIIIRTIFSIDLPITLHVLEKTLELKQIKP